ncbi:MAG: VCBS repeat-containing protein [Candidatus Latescibacterota bacterium]|nr:VCBS repeat-containing protein [Candidatus Latescibacterota bacterium]
MGKANKDKGAWLRGSLAEVMGKALLCALLLGWGPLYGEELDQAAVEQVEGYTESLANQLHDLSLLVLDREVDGMAAHAAADLEAWGLPVHVGEPRPQGTWVAVWDTLAGARVSGRAGWVEDWRRYLVQFAAIEDVRFKVKQAHFEEGQVVRAAALVYLALVGRDPAGRRQWVEAKAHLEAVLGAEERWSIDYFDLKKYAARVARFELFSEVARPAGVYRVVPRFGQPGNQAFMAHGIAVADVDQDGWVDALATGPGQNFLYLNQGDGTFADRAADAGVQFSPPANGPLFLDRDNDGDVDLFLATPGFQLLFDNRLRPDGAPDFIDVSQEAGVAYPAQGYSAAAADIDQDGWADIYVSSYNQYGTIMPNSWSQATNGTPNLLFVNRGDGTFAEAAASRGVADSRWSYAAVFADVDEDGDPDLYVANDFGENGYYRNDGAVFVDAAGELGLSDPGNGMGASFGDFDNDGHLDLHVTNMSSTAGNRILQRLFPDAATQMDQTRVLNKLAAGNTLFRNVGGGQFEDVSQAVGPFGAGWAFGGGFVDFDNDGWEDLHAPNGFISGKSLKDT